MTHESLSGSNLAAVRSAAVFSVVSWSDLVDAILAEAEAKPGLSHMSAEGDIVEAAIAVIGTGIGPETVLTLLDEIDSLRAQLDHAQEGGTEGWNPGIDMALVRRQRMTGTCSVSFGDSVSRYCDQPSGHNGGHSSKHQG